MINRTAKGQSVRHYRPSQAEHGHRISRRRYSLTFAFDSIWRSRDSPNRGLRCHGYDDVTVSICNTVFVVIFLLEESQMDVWFIVCLPSVLLWLVVVAAPIAVAALVGVLLDDSAEIEFEVFQIQTGTDPVCLLHLLARSLGIFEARGICNRGQKSSRLDVGKAGQIQLEDLAVQEPRTVVQKGEQTDQEGVPLSGDSVESPESALRESNPGEPIDGY